MTETCYENTTQTATFRILAETFIHTTYILRLQQAVRRLTMEILMWQCTNETTQTAMDNTPTTTFWNLANTFMHTICKLQREQPVYRFKSKHFDLTVHKWNNSNNQFFDWQQECFEIKDNLCNQFFIITSTDELSPTKTFSMLFVQSKIP